MAYGMILMSNNKPTIEIYLIIENLNKQQHNNNTQ